MGVMQFSDFVYTVRERLGMLEIEPAFQDGGEVARFMWPPHTAELQVIDSANVRLSLSAHGELIRTIELPLTEDAAWLASNGIVAVFEPDPPGEPVN